MPKKNKSHPAKSGLSQSPWGDPHAAREAKKYENPIPSRELILELLSASNGPLNRYQMAEAFSFNNEDQVDGLRRRLRAMERDGQLVSDRRGAYGRLDKMDLLRCRVQGHKDGYGFAIPLEGGEDDLYLHQRQMRKVFDGDEVLVRVSGEDWKGRREGAIVDVLAHNTHQLVGRIYRDGGICSVRPESKRITHDVMIAADDCGNAENGQYVSVEITRQPSRDELPLGRVLEVLGDHMAPGMEIDVAIRNHSIPHLWPTEVQGETAELSAEVLEKDKAHRWDLRELPFVTIDGEDARDFDDAVYCEPADGKNGKNGWRLYVAIADVSHYVQVGSALDQEAHVRSTSVYFPDHVVPMLPEALSNGLCSLNPAVDRLCMVCEMTIDNKGSVTGFQFYEGVMHSFARLTYNQVGEILENQSTPLRKEYAGLVPHLEDLHSLYKVLRAARDIRGAIDFETTETQILFDENRKIDRIVPRTRNDAHKLIEECMLAANVCAATFLQAHNIDGLYRVHESPSEERLGNLQEFLGELGMGIGFDPQPSDYQALLRSVSDRPDAHLIQTVMLRSMQQAVYRPDNDGHFGLAYDAYAHFTSPIRRYPDLLVHRAIRSVIRSEQNSQHVARVAGAKKLPKAKIYPYDMAQMLSLGEHCSTCERRADEATRDVVSWLKCEFLQDHVGDTFEGVVSAVVAFGLFVELNDLFVEGLIHITTLPSDYYHHDAAKHRLIGERTRQTFQLGDELKVKVVGVSLDDRKVDFELEGFPRRQRKKKDNADKTFAKKSSKKATVKKSSKARVKEDAQFERKRKPKKKSASKKSKSKVENKAAKKPAKKADKKGKNAKKR